MEFVKSRPTTSGGRPGTSSGRPGTSSGRRGSTTAAAFSDIGPDIENVNAESLILKEVGQDDFLRITNHARFIRENKALLATEDGRYQDILKLVESGLDVTTCKGLNGLSLLHIAASKGHGLLIS